MFPIGLKIEIKMFLPLREKKIKTRTTNKIIMNFLEEINAQKRDIIQY